MYGKKAFMVKMAAVAVVAVSLVAADVGLKTDMADEH